MDQIVPLIPQVVILQVCSIFVLFLVFFLNYLQGGIPGLGELMWASFPISTTISSDSWYFRSHYFKNNAIFFTLNLCFKGGWAKSMMGCVHVGITRGRNCIYIFIVRYNEIQIDIAKIHKEWRSDITFTKYYGAIPCSIFGL